MQWRMHSGAARAVAWRQQVGWGQSGLACIAGALLTSSRQSKARAIDLNHFRAEPVTLTLGPAFRSNRHPKANTGIVAMDTAVALVEAYLRINGYFTVTEYPVLEVSRADDAHMISDLDVLAFRFPAAGHDLRVRRHGALRGDSHSRIDPALGASPTHADMIVGEVKRGQARFNPATRNAEVLAAGLLRFGCCPTEDALPLARRLLAHGVAESVHGHRVRMVAFGQPGEALAQAWHTVALTDIVGFLQRHLEAHWDALRHVHFSSDVLDLLALLERAKPKAPHSPTTTS